jgi:hypothetical protein
MKHAFVIAALLMVQATAFAATRENQVNYNDPALNTAANKKECWKRHAPNGQTFEPRMINAVGTAPVQTFERTARSLRTI